MRLVIVGFIALGILAAQAVANPPQSSGESWSLIGSFGIAIAALVTVVKVLYSDNKALHAEIKEEYRESRDAMRAIVEKYAALATKVEEKLNDK